MKNSLDVVTIGEAMAMFVATQTGELADVEQFIKRVAGAELNVATGLARLGLKVGWVSRVGNDSFGRFIVKSLEKKGLMRRESPGTGVTLPAFSLNLKSKMEPIPLWNISAKVPLPATSALRIITRPISPARATCT